MVNYIGNYDYYLEHVDEQNARLFGVGVSALDTGILSSSTRNQASASSAAMATPASAASTGAADWKAQKEEQARKRKLEAALKKCEEEIAKLEKRDGEITAQLSDPSIGTDLGKLRKLTDEQSEIQEKLSTLYDEWEELSVG